MSGMRLMALEDGYTIEVSSFGKIKTIFQDLGIFCLLMRDNTWFDLPFPTIGMSAIWLALLVSLYSGYLYFKEFLGNSSNITDCP